MSSIAVFITFNNTIMNFDYCDLHMHTVNSDGSKTLEEIKAMVYAQGGKKLVSITDHQYMTMQEIVEENDTVWIPGIEVSAVADGVNVHITGYGTKPVYTEKLQALLKTIVDGYNARAEKVRNKWISLGYDVPPLADFRDSALPPPIYKSDLVKQIAVLAGTQDLKEARERARNNGKLLYVEEENFMPDVKELIPAMHESGLIACWAHPGKGLFRTQEEMDLSYKTLDYIINCGIDGIEAYAHKHTPEQTAFFEKLGDEKGLLVTGGSDYHGNVGHSIGFEVPINRAEAFLKKIGY